ncbi:MAG: hypothetical protein ACXWJK_04915 [Burkholderiaceae bacterium]
MQIIPKRLRNRAKAIYSLPHSTKYLDKSSSGGVSFGGVAAWLSGITLTLTIISITLYAAGKAYRSNYLRHFGATDTLIQYQPQDLVYLGTTAQLDTLLLVYPVIAGALILMIIVMFLLHRLGIAAQKYSRMMNLVKNAPALSKGRRENDPTAPNTETAFAALLVLIGFILFLIFVLCISYVARAERLGLENAVGDRTAMLSGDAAQIKKRNLIFSTIERSIQGKAIIDTGYPITCSEKACLLFQPISNIDSKIGNGKPVKKTKYIPLDNLIRFDVNVAK